MSIVHTTPPNDNGRLDAANTMFDGCYAEHDAEHDPPIDTELADCPPPAARSRRRGKRANTAARGNNGHDGGMIHVVTSLICAKNHFARDAGGKLHVYRDGAYRPDGEIVLRRLVKATCLAMGIEAVAKWNRSLVADIVAYVLADCAELWERPPLDRLCVENGLLDLSDPAKPVLLPHSPDYLSPVQLPVTYDPNATCPAINEFVSQVFPADAIDLAFEIAAWLMLPQTSIQKAVLLIGPGGNGKSVYLRLILALLGRANCCGLSLHRLESDKFAAARLVGKLANVCPDLPSEHLAGTNVFKILTGSDGFLPAEYKFRDSFEFEPFARLVFSANSPPRSPDSSPGFFDRWLVIPFDRSFRGTAAEIPGDVLDARLHDPRELSGLLNRAIAALPRLRGKCGFTQSASTTKAWEEFHASTDPTAVWLDRFTIDDPAAVTPKKVLRIAFNAELERQGKPAPTETAFGLAFHKLRPNVTIKQRTIGGKVQWCYVGIGLLSDSQPSQGSQGSTICSYRESNFEETEVEINKNKSGHPVNPVNRVKVTL